MTATTATAGSTPKHYWVVTILAVLWNGFGAYDYIMSNTAGDAYFRQMGMTDAQIAYMHSYPTWMVAVWALGVWSSVAGTVFLLLKRKWAFHAFALSFAMIVVSIIYTYGMSNGAEVMGSTAAMQGVVTAACAFFAWYSQRMTKQGVLR